MIQQQQKKNIFTLIATITTTMDKIIELILSISFVVVVVFFRWSFLISSPSVNVQSDQYKYYLIRCGEGEREKIMIIIISSS